MEHHGPALGRVKQRLAGLVHVPFEFESHGSQIIFHEPEEDYAKHDRARSKKKIEAFRELDSDSP